MHAGLDESSVRIWFEKHEDNVALVGVGNLHREWRNFGKGDENVFFLILQDNGYWNWMVHGKGNGYVLITSVKCGNLDFRHRH